MVGEEWDADSVAGDAEEEWTDRTATLQMVETLGITKIFSEQVIVSLSVFDFLYYLIFLHCK